VPEAKDVVSTGMLLVDDDGITFTTAPEYSRDLRMADIASEISSIQSAREKLLVLHGFTGQGNCTLCQLVDVEHPGLRHFGLEQSIAAISYRALVCVIGVHFGGLTDKCFDSARYTFSGLSEWVPKATTEQWEPDQILIKIPHKEREIFAVCLHESHAEVSLKVYPEVTTSDLDGGRVTRSVPYVEVRSAGPECLSWYREVGARIENLFSLFTGTSQALETFFLYRGEDSGTVIERRYSHARPFSQLECVTCTTAELANSVAIWLNEPPRFRSVESLALGVLRKGKLFVETEFLSLAQALEGFHRATTQADSSFASRLSDLCQRIDAAVLVRMRIDIADFISNVVATRNFYTHAGGDPIPGKPSPLDGAEMFFLNQKMRALLRGVMLRHLEIPEERIADVIVRESTRWH